jgi:hypothetical protein
VRVQRIGLPIGLLIGFATLSALIGSCAGGSEETVTTFEPLTEGSNDTSAVDTGTSPNTTNENTSSGSSGSEGGSDTDCIPVTWYRDADGDGRGDPDVTMVACTAPAGYVGPGDDCDDTDPDVHPFADEVCDGLDNNCNALVDEHSPHNAVCNGCTTAAMGDDAFWFCPVEASWQGGQEQCNALFEADLVTIASGVVNSFLVENAPEGPPSWWIGLNDIAVEGMFVWPDGTPATYTNWNEGEPNDAGGIEDCVEIGSATGGWNDVPCDTLKTYICGASAP